MTDGSAMGDESAVGDGSMTDDRPPLSSAFDAGPALVPYVTAGDPTPEATAAFVDALERGGADAIELGLPFSEPIAEGPTIQNAIFRALDAGMTPDRFFEVVADLDVDVPLVVMTYYNIVYQYGSSDGPAAFAKAAADAGLSGLIVPDLPVEESDPLREACDEHDLDLVFIVAPTTDGDRLDELMAATSGFAYVQARLGTTGARTDVSGATFDSLTRLEEYAVPKAVGFGVSEPSHARAIVDGGADGVIVGSALVDIVAECTSDGRSVEDVADELEATVRELRRGARIGQSTRGEPQHK